MVTHVRIPGCLIVYYVDFLWAVYKMVVLVVTFW